MLRLSLCLVFLSPVISEAGEVRLRGVHLSGLGFLLLSLVIISLFWARSYLPPVEVGVSKNFLIFYVLLLALALTIFFSLNRTLKIYISFELRVLPIFIIIIGWGYQRERLRARLSLLFYTLRASMPLLISFLWLGRKMSQTTIFLFYSDGGL